MIGRSQYPPCPEIARSPVSREPASANPPWTTRAGEPSVPRNDGFRYVSPETASGGQGCFGLYAKRGTWKLTANLKSLGLDILDNLNSGLLNVGHILAVAVLTEEAGSADDDIEAVDTSLNSELGIAHIATDVSQDLGLYVKNRVSRGSWRAAGPAMASGRTLRPSLQMASQSLRDCSEAAGEVNSM